jgi:tetratricopeptide (TPR) repeat protein
MADAGFSTATIPGLTRADGWAPIRRALGIRSFGINAWSTTEAGGALVPEHDEDEHEELYLVIAGHATFTLNDEQLDAPTGTLVLVSDPKIVRKAVAVTPNTTVLAVGAEPGAAFTPNSWETNRDVLALFGEQRHDEVKDLLLTAVDEYQDPSYLLYNLACADAQLGETDEALDYLTQAISVRPELAQIAANDDDLAALREDPRFAELVRPRS